jgi:hypothetical protein
MRAPVSWMARSAACGDEVIQKSFFVLRYDIGGSSTQVVKQITDGVLYVIVGCSVEMYVVNFNKAALIVQYLDIIGNALL